MVGRQAVDQERADAGLLESPGRAAEHVALGPAPVLAVDPADAVTAAAEGEPDGQPGVDDELDARHRESLPDERHGLHEDEVRRLLGERAEEELERRAAPLAVDVAVHAEGDGARVRPPRLLDRLAGQPHPKPGDVHPVHRRAAPDEAGRLELRGGEDRPRVRRGDVAAHLDVAAVDVQHRVRGVVERPGPPEAAVGIPQLPGALAPQLGRVAAVEDDGLVVRDQAFDPLVGRRDPLHAHRHRRRYRPRNSGVRFSAKAAMPSRWSSVPKSMAKRRASVARLARWSPWRARLTASFA